MYHHVMNKFINVSCPNWWAYWWGLTSSYGVSVVFIPGGLVGGAQTILLLLWHRLEICNMQPSQIMLLRQTIMKFQDDTGGPRLPILILVWQRQRPCKALFAANASCFLSIMSWSLDSFPGGLVLLCPSLTSNMFRIDWLTGPNLFVSSNRNSKSTTGPQLL